jgi:glycolate oxidase FAD binding subunit
MSYAPQSEAEVQSIVAAAASARTPLRILGGGTRQGIGRPINAAVDLSVAGLTGITLFEPAEMVIGARAGTPLAEIERTLAASRQMLPFEPMDHRPLLGTTGEPTIGAVAAGNISGPRRISAGAARDSLIGVRFVNGKGEAIKSGGRVMKNVTGLDLVKLQAGSWGTLGVLTEVIFKLLPQPETSLTLVLHGLDDARGVAALAAGLTTPFEVSGAAHVPARDGQPAQTLLRLEGFENALKYRSKALAAALRSFAPAEVVPVDRSVRLWRSLADAAPLGAAAETAVWRLSVKPSDGSRIVAAVAAAMPLHRHFYDWGGGLVWLETASAGDAGAAIIRAAVAAHGGHATLVRGPAALRAAVPPFQPEAAALARISEGIRRAVDPDALFNPGLMG